MEDRSGGDPDLLSTNVTAFLNAARKRPELAHLNTTFEPSVPQVYIDVDLERALKQGVAVSDIYQTIQTFMGGSFVNYFNRFGREWQVYVCSRYYSGSIIETITYTEARDRFADVLNRVEATRDVILITRRGHANVALIAEEELSSLRETAYLLRSSANARRLLESLARSMAGRIVT